MRFKIHSLILVLFVTLFVAPEADAQGKLRVVTTIPDLKSITELIGGDHVDVFAIAAGYQNPHFVDPKPSFIVRLSRADMFVTIGLDLEQGWVPPLLISARNPDIMKGGKGYVDASENVPLLEVPTSVSREQGDIHIFGNPHYWLHPALGKYIAQNIHRALVRLRPEARDEFDENLAVFDQTLDEKMKDLGVRMTLFRGARIMAYHNQWPYFEAAFGLDIVDFLEPKPGIPPTPSQLAKVIRTMERENLRVIIIAPYFKKDAAELVARNVNGIVVTLASSVGAFPEVETYFDLFDYNVERMLEAFNFSAH